MSYSEHFRRKILAKLEEGYSIRAVAAQFEINKNTIVEWKKRIEIKKLVYNSLLQSLIFLEEMRLVWHIAYKYYFRQAL